MRWVAEVWRLNFTVLAPVSVAEPEISIVTLGCIVGLSAPVTINFNVSTVTSLEVMALKLLDEQEESMLPVVTWRLIAPASKQYAILDPPAARNVMYDCAVTGQSCGLVSVPEVPQ
jgi:hypothetical protein